MHPTDHQLAAALRVAKVVDDGGNTATDIQSTYSLHLSQGEHRPDDLRAGEVILVRLDLLRQSDTGQLSVTPAGGALARMGEDEGIAYLKRLLALRGESVSRAELGAEGERVVVAACQTELNELGHPELARSVSQVSVLDDTLGYDIAAPSIAGPARKLEVKTASALRAGIFRFYLTRNEHDRGHREPETWSLVACARTSEDGPVEIVGWCRAASLGPYVPEDGNGRWTEAAVNLPQSALFPGHPPPL